MDTYALLIGIPTYNRYSGLPSLRGALADVADMRRTIEECTKGNGALHVRSAPGELGKFEHWTEEAIREGAAWLAREAGTGDRVVFYFSGHGDRVLLPGRGEPCEIIMPYDFRHKDDPFNVDEHDKPLGLYRHYLTDEDLDRAATAIVEGESNMLMEVILDSCHSVGMGDADYSRGCFCVPGEAKGIQCVLWAAALTRADYRDQGKDDKGKEIGYRSSFTYEFCAAIRKRPDISRRELLEVIDDRTQTYSRLECCNEFKHPLRGQPPFRWKPVKTKSKPKTTGVSLAA